MSIFDLLFLLLALTTLVALVRSLIAVFRRRGAVARRILARLGLGLGLYLVVLLIVSVATPRQTVGLGEPQCSDDWCISVTDVGRTGDGSRDRYEVTFQLASRAARISQRERFVVAWLEDAGGHRYDPEPAGSEPPFDVRLGPLESVATHRRYTLPDSVRPVGVVVAREGGFNFPGCCVIGDNQSLLHQRRLVRIDPDRLPAVKAAGAFGSKGPTE